MLLYHRKMGRIIESFGLKRKENVIQICTSNMPLKVVYKPVLAVRINKDSDNQGPDKRGCTSHVKTHY